MLFLIVPNGPG